MRILFVGKTDFKYNRDLILLNGLRKRPDVDVETLQIKKRNWSTFKSIKQTSKKYDLIIVPTFRHKDVAYIKAASTIPVIFDPLISKYMTKVLDYGVRWKGPHKYLVDFWTFFWADTLIWDTKAHLDYIRTMYRYTKPMKEIYIGVDTSLFYPLAKRRKTDKTVIGFYGSFNPLQGIDKIVRTAYLLRDHSTITFSLIGSGSTYSAIRKLAHDLGVSNIEFLPKVPYESLNEAINTFDICLGIFGDSLKADVVIPNKLYHYAAAGKCIITKDTPATREIFTPGRDIVLTDNQPEAMAKCILTLIEDAKKREHIAENAFHLITQKYNQDQIAHSFVQFLKSLV